MSVRDVLLSKLFGLKSVRVCDDDVFSGGFHTPMVPKAIYLSRKNLHELMREALLGDFGMAGKFQGIPIFVVDAFNEEAEPHLVVHGEFE